MMEICDSGSCLSVDGSLKDQVNYRAVRTTDVEQLKALHDELFPVKYSDKFYEDACRGIGLFKRPLYCIVVTIPTPIKQLEGTEINEPGAKNGNIGEEAIEKTDKYVVKETMIGFVLAQFMRTSECGDDDLFNSLFYSPPLDVFYILTIGVVDKYRGMHVGSTLLRMVYEHANANNKCGCVSI
jgi:ribosomal protein S18 acetylase RimI-like enzyme